MNNLNKIYVVVEIPKNSLVKYEINKNNNKLYIDRFVKIPYPFNYGYIEKTISLDNDALDAIVLTEYKIYPKSIILCKPIGVLNMSDESGNDNKIICIPDESLFKYNNNIYSINQISKHSLDKIIFFFKNYKKNDKTKWSHVIGYKNEIYAKKEILECKKRFNLK